MTGRQIYCANLPHALSSKEEEPPHMMVFCLTAIQLPVYVDVEGIVAVYNFLALIIRCAQIFLPSIFVVEYYPKN